MRRALLVLAILLGLVSTAKAQGPATIANLNTAYPGGVGGDSVAIAATPLDSVRTYEAGLYRIVGAIIVTTAGSGGTNPRDSLVYTCPGNNSTQTYTAPGFAETAAAGTELDASFTCWANPTSTVPITYSVVDGGTQGTHVKFRLAIRVERLF